MSTPIRIGAREVGRNVPPLVIAEMSGNHNQSLQRALAIVEAAAASGACVTRYPWRVRKRSSA